MKNIRLLKLVKSLIAILFFIPLYAHALGIGCTINSSQINFGVYNFLQEQPNDSSGQVTVTCAVSASVTLQVGAGQSASFTTRYLVNAKNNDKLYYNLYTNSQRTTIAGDGTSSSNTYVGGGLTLLTGQTFSVYARVLPNQNITAGSYTDAISLVLVY